MPWETHAGQARPWRGDARLSRYGEPGYPDDFQVRFANPDSARGGVPEMMWVRVIAEDSAHGLFLGILLNKPYSLKTVAEGDNVVFRTGGAGGYPTAVGAPAFAEAGWPPTRAPGFASTLKEGIRAYRNGNNGHNEPEIEHCIKVLTPLMSAIPPATSHEERFVGHFVLGRCLAEKYVTLRAIEQFRAAIALEPNDLDANMALLAELSLMTHRRPGELSPADEARWERDFTDQLRVVRTSFGNDFAVANVLGMIFDPALEADVDSLWKPHMARLRRVGYATFRWKQR